MSVVRMTTKHRRFLDKVAVIYPFLMYINPVKRQALRFSFVVSDIKRQKKVDSC